MRVLTVGETSSGSLLNSLLTGLRRSFSDLIVLDPHGHGTAKPRPVARLQRKWDSLSTGRRVVDAVEDLSPDVVLLVKGRGLGRVEVAEIQRSGARVACYYPDNPFWTKEQEPDALGRLLACDLAVTFSERQALALGSLGARTSVLPFGYDSSWFNQKLPVDRRCGIAFLGTWSHKRQRFLSSLKDLPVPLVVRGTGWERQKAIAAGPPAYQEEAGRILAQATIGVNLMHPQCVGAHNMRTREITACGALELTEPGTDGSPLRDRESALWFTSPEELRRLVMDALHDPSTAARIAAAGTAATLTDTYDSRGQELADLLVGLR